MHLNYTRHFRISEKLLKNNRPVISNFTKNRLKYISGIFSGFYGQLFSKTCTNECFCGYWQDNLTFFHFSKKVTKKKMDIVLRKTIRNEVEAILEKKGGKDEYSTPNEHQKKKSEQRVSKLLSCIRSRISSRNENGKIKK